MLRTSVVAIAIVLTLGVASRASAAGQLPLLQAAKTGDVAAVRALIKAGTNVNAVEGDGSTALHHAANRGDLQTIDALIAAGARVKTANRYGVTPFSLACATGNAAVIERFLKAGADANATTAGGETALMTAARTGSAEAIKVLLAYGADVKAKDTVRSQTALMWAAAAGNVAGMKALIEGGADVRARSNEHEFRLYEEGTVSATGTTNQTAEIQFSPLMFAIRAGHQAAVKLLLDSGADPNEKLPDGVNGVILAIINAHWELAAYLIDRGADVNSAEGGWTALHQLARSRSLTIGHVPHPMQTGRMTSLELAKKLIEKGANVNARITRDGMKVDGYRTQLKRIDATPYLLAAKGVDHELMRLLLANGADPLLTNVDGQRPLGVAAGLSIHATGEDSGTPEDALEAVKVAYEADKDVNYKDKRGVPLIIGAARRGVIPVVQFFVEHGADLSITIKREDYVGATYGTKGQIWSPLTVAFGVEKDGRTLFLGAEQFPDLAAYLYKEMKERGITFDHEEPRALALLQERLGDKPPAASASAK